MKTFLFRLYLAMMKFLASLQKEDPNCFVILNGAGRSGSNGYLFYRYLKKEHPEATAYLMSPGHRRTCLGLTGKKSAEPSTS